MSYSHSGPRLFPRLVLLTVLAAALPLAGPTYAQGPPCKPCGGLLVDDPSVLVPLLQAEPRLGEEERLYVAWPVSLDTAPAAAQQAVALRGAGARPWLRLIFRTPRPILEHVDRLATELETAATLGKQAGEGAHFQILWQPENDAGGDASAATADYAYLLKRASVAVAGALDDAVVVTAPLAANPDALTALYGEDVAAYLQGIALAPAADDELAAAVARLAELDPGKPIVLDAAPWPGDARLTLPEAARWAAAGFALSFFESPAEVTAAQLVPLKILAREFQGDLSLDPYSTPSGAAEAWSFVRGEDLQLRVVARTGGEGELRLSFPDSQLTRPSEIDPGSGEIADIFGQQRTGDAFSLRLDDPGPVALLRVERMSAAELEGLAGLEEKVTVEGERQMPVEEILRRLQAFEDNQARRLDHYQAINTMHLRFAAGTGVQGFEASLEGPFFFERGKGFDWAWETLYFNGVRWRGKELPEFPLLQPEKAAALPLEINFTKEYRYRLRGTDVVDGRDCWVVDFSPAVEVTPERTLYQGTVWVDREHFGPVRTRALQLGLEGEVLSNEETFYFSPVDPIAGSAAEWTPDSLWLPLRVVGQQLLSVLNATIVVEKETVLTALEFNGPDFAARRTAVMASNSTMVRDTDQGLRYLVKDEETGERKVQEKDNPSRLFAVAGVFWDEAQDFPLPLGGVNFFSYDFRESGKQVNLFFAGALLIGNVADPDLFGSKWDAGANVFALAFSGSDTPYQGGEEILAEEIESRPARISAFLGRPLGSFGKLDLTYSLSFTDYSTSSDTADDFVLPQDHFTQGFSLETSYNRGGYRLRAGAEQNLRSDWQPWGRPGSASFDAFDPDTEEYTLWNFGVAKTWWLPSFQKFGIELEYRDGRNLDRFSKYQFGYFSDVRVHGYQSDKIRASEAYAAHLTYGFEVGELLRLELVGDGAWATDEETGLDREFLGGVGISGNFIGPWDTLVNLDAGVAVAGPDDGVSIFVAFLKLFR